MVSTSDDNTTTNKGVNARSDSSPVAIHKKCCDLQCLDTSTSSASSLLQNRSLNDIKHEIQNVLDLMGPSTPNYTTTQNTSSEADNEEESLISLPPASQKAKTPKTSPLERDRSASTDNEKIESIMTDAGTISNFNSLEVEHACYDHQRAGPCLCLNPECICMVGCMNQVPPPPPVQEPCLNPECVCMVSYMNQESVRVPVSTQSDFLNLRSNSQGYISTNKSATRVVNDCGRKRSLLDWLKTRSVEMIMKKSSSHNPCELYKINICEDGGRPKRVVFDLVDGIPKPSSSNVATNTIRSPVEKYKSNFKYRCDDQKMVTTCDCKGTKNLKNETIQETQHMSRDCDGDTRADFYYFDHGNAQYFHTTDTAPVMVCEVIAEKTEKYTTKFWAEIFATIHIAFSFFISFVLQLFKFLLYGILRPLTVGLMQLSSDYCFKPFLTTLFNGIVQPCLIFLYNVATSVRDLCDPIAECCGYFLRELAVLFRAIRLCTYKKNVDDNCECRASPREKKRKYIC